MRPFPNETVEIQRTADRALNRYDPDDELTHKIAAE